MKTISYTRKIGAQAAIVLVFLIVFFACEQEERKKNPSEPEPYVDDNVYVDDMKWPEGGTDFQGFQLGFWYTGAGGGGQFLDDVVLQDPDTGEVLWIEGFEEGQLPSGWQSQFAPPEPAWEIIAPSPAEDPEGDHSEAYAAFVGAAEIDVLRDAWLITSRVEFMPPARFEISFLTAGDIATAADATLNAVYSCDGGASGMVFYTFPDPDQSETMTWLPVSFIAECP